MAITAWLDGFERVDLGPDGDAFADTSHPKGCLHTMETASVAVAEATYGRYPPHVGVDVARRVRRQYVRLDRASYALSNMSGGIRPDTEFVIQIELNLFAARTGELSDADVRWLGEAVCGPIARAVGIPHRFVRFYGAGEGIVLATPTSPVRMSGAEFRAYSGWLGHQHVPENSHWDPGAMHVDRILAAAYDNPGGFLMALTDQQQSEVHEWLRRLYGDVYQGEQVDGSKLRGKISNHSLRVLAEGTAHRVAAIEKAVAALQAPGG